MSRRHKKADFQIGSQLFLLEEWAVAHAARGSNGRQEGCECGYYHLHRNLNDFLLHTLFRLNVSWRRSDTWGLAPMCYL